jgi:DNA-binding ferritin-like protein
MKRCNKMMHVKVPSDTGDKEKYKGWLPSHDEISDATAKTLKEAIRIMSMAQQDVTTVSSSELFAKLISGLYALYTLQRIAHWRSSGEMFYGDHLMYQRMYEATNDEIDAVTERALGSTRDDTMLEPVKFLSLATQSMKSVCSTADVASSLLNAENALIAAIVVILEALKASSKLTDGIENLLQGIADKHEEHVYLLSRRLKMDVLAGCVKETIEKFEHAARDARILRQRLIEAKKKKGKKKKKPVAWNIGGPISTGPGNPGFGSSGGEGTSCSG